MDYRFSDPQSKEIREIHEILTSGHYPYLELARDILAGETTSDAMARELRDDGYSFVTEEAMARYWGIVRGDVFGSLYDLAVEYVQERRRLATYADIILVDWPNMAEHLEWVLTAHEREIVDWAETIRKDVDTGENA